jgi:transcriptional regulator with XRE-family HTH domain
MARKANKQSAQFDQQFAARLAELVARKQVPVAKKAGVLQQSLSGWVNGTSIKARDAVRLAEALEVSVEWLLTGKESEAPAGAGELNLAWLVLAIRYLEAAAGDLPLRAEDRARAIAETYKEIVKQHGKAPTRRKILSIVRAA